jgi:tetratricopeptide (TPR) repeat protein
VAEPGDSGGRSEGGDALTEVTLADSLADSIAGQIAARIDASPSVPEDALDWAAVAGGYEREAFARADDPSGAAALLFEAGRIFEVRLHSPADALVRHRQAFERDPTFLPNLHAARRLATHLGDDSFVVDLLAAEERLENDPAARADLAAHRVRWLLALGRVAEATAVLQEHSSSGAPSFAMAEAQATAAAAAGDAKALADAWTRCAETATDATLAPRFQAAAATVLEEAIGDRARAAELISGAFARCPNDPFLRGAARRNAECSGRWEDLASLLRTEAEESGGREAAAAWTAAAWVEQSRLGRLPAAVECFQQAARAAPQSPDILRALARAQEAAGEIAGETEALAALAEVFANRGAPAERKEAVDVLLRLATLEELRGRLPEAVAACRDALALEPGERAILSMLGRLCARSGDYDGVANAYLAEADVAADPADRGRLLLRAAEVLELRLDRPQTALDTYREAMAADPSVVPARDALERIYTRTGDWQALLAMLEVDLGEIRAPRERVAQLFRIAQIQEERLSDPMAAAATWRRLLVIEPDHLIALRSLARCLEGAGLYAETVEVLGSEGAVVEDPRRRAALHARRADLLEAKLRDPEAARLEWEQVLAIDPHNVPAQRALGKLHAGAERGGDLISLLRREADGAPSPAAAAAILVRAGATASRLGRGDDEAISLYREALTLAPDHLSALESLAGIYRRRGDAEALIEVLRSRAAATTVPEVRACSLIEAARLFEEKLGDPAQAIVAYEEGLAADPGQLAARAALDRLHSCAGHKDALRTLRSAPSAPSTSQELAHRVAMELGEGGDRTAARDAALAIGRMRAKGTPAIVALAGGLPSHARAQSAPPSRRRPATRATSP